MAKKKEALTPEQRLQEALVPCTEWTYKVPENWCWTNIGTICSFIGGGTPDKSVAAFWNGDIPWASVKDIKGSYLFSTIDSISEEGLKNSAANQCKIDDLILVTRIEPGKAIIAKIESAINQDLKIVKSRLSSQFLYFYFLNFQSWFIAKSSGSTVKGITLPNIKSMYFPLPPLPEQQRIVERIEGLFARLDEAKEKAQTALDSFEPRKAAILHKAFTGELTAKWREGHGIGMESWSTATIGDVFSVFSGKGFKENEYSLTGVKLLRISNVTYDSLIWDDTKYLPSEYIDLASELLLQPTDIVMALNRPITNGRLKISVVNDTSPIILYQRVGCLRQKQSHNIDFLRYELESMDFLHQVETNLQGSDQPYINLPPLKKLTIAICSIQEQQEIVRILDSLLAKEQQAREAAEAVLEQIDLTKKSILSRAFRGELGTNNPTEESATELLKEILKKEV